MYRDRVCQHRRQFWLELGTDLDRGRECSAHDLHRPPNCGWQILCSATIVLAATERKNLLYQFHRPCGTFLDLVMGAVRRTIGRQLGSGELNAATNRGEDIVEVVRNAPCKLTDSLHFLCL